MGIYTEKVYANDGNRFLLTKLSKYSGKILDVGSGSGGNARYIKSWFPLVKIYGLTLSESEKRIAQVFFDRIWVADVENSSSFLAAHGPFDVIILSHVLEHLREPHQVLDSLKELLTADGVMLVAVPNISYLNQRLRHLIGDFNYSETGIMDRTHLRFFNYYNIESVLNIHKSELIVLDKDVDSVAPFGRMLTLMGSNIKSKFNRLFGRIAPNLFGWQITLVIRKAK